MGNICMVVAEEVVHMNLQIRNGRNDGPAP